MSPMNLFPLHWMIASWVCAYCMLRMLFCWVCQWMNIQMQSLCCKIRSLSNILTHDSLLFFSLASTNATDKTNTFQTDLCIGHTWVDIDNFFFEITIIRKTLVVVVSPLFSTLNIGVLQIFPFPASFCWISLPNIYRPLSQIVGSHLVIFSIFVMHFVFDQFILVPSFWNIHSIAIVLCQRQFEKHSSVCEFIDRQ